jgi:hypothetical protein
LPSRQEIERILEEELNQKKIEYARARSEFSTALKESSAGMLSADASQRISKRRKADSAALRAYMLALREFTAYVIHGTLPERLKHLDDDTKSSGQ